MGDWVTENEIALAKEVAIEKIASAMGYTPIRKGNYISLREMDSLMINTAKNQWIRYSDQSHGSSVDFIMQFGNFTFQEAVVLCLNYENIPREIQNQEVNYQNEINKKIERRKALEVQGKKEMVLPEKAENYRRLYAYLIKTRKLSKGTVDYFVKNHYCYEEKNYHNIVFLGKDSKGIIKHAAKRGTNDFGGIKGTGFKGDVEGNDKNYGFNLVQDSESEQVVVFEAAIDLMSHYEIEKSKDNLLSLAMLSDKPLQTFLYEHPKVKKIIFALDHDFRGAKAKEDLMQKYKKMGYDVAEYSFPGECKDVNDYLKQIKKKLKKKWER